MKRTVTCPNCKHTFDTSPSPAAKKWCRRCKQAIGLHHKYVFVKNGLEHRHCDNPTSYHAREVAA